MISTCQKFALFTLRMGVGWLMFYAGITKVIDPTWSAEGYLMNAQTFPGLFAWFAQPNILPLINFINEWGLTLLGVSLILGIGVRLSSTLGIVLMLLYYFSAVEFPFVPHGFLVDDHIINALALGVLAAFRAGRVWGLERMFGSLPLIKALPKREGWLG